MFYQSEYFEAHREEYIDSLNALHQDPTAGYSNPFLNSILSTMAKFTIIEKPETKQ